jgi:hypothetical protein
MAKIEPYFHESIELLFFFSFNFLFRQVHIFLNLYNQTFINMDFIGSLPTTSSPLNQWYQIHYQFNTLELFSYGYLYIKKQTPNEPHNHPK